METAFKLKPDNIEISQFKYVVIYKAMSHTFMFYIFFRTRMVTSVCPVLDGRYSFWYALNVLMMPHMA